LQLDPAVAQWFAAAKGEFPPSRSSAIPMLQSAQAAFGYLPRDAMRAIARHLRVAPAVVEGIASFYAQFRFNAPGRHRVTVCSGTACYVRGSGKLMEDIQADLKIAPGATSADGAVTLESVSCFGACALAPVVVLDDKVLRQQTGASVKALIQELADKPGTAKPGTDPKQKKRGQSPRGARK
jgi:NADH-quinone oxidoreductase subunit E